MTVRQAWGSGLSILLGVLALMAGFLLLCAPLALAAPPPNDNFANRELLSGSLPIEVTRSNVEATKETGEYIPGLAPAGHSVWFEWEAQSTGWVTIGACGDEFPTILAVFTGTELEHLTPATSGNASEGPDCHYEQRQYTFKATAGTEYVIAVDGNSFHLPEAPAPVTEGEIILRIEETPPPSNDDFANATPIVSHLEEEFEGEAFYFGSAFGYNWGATTESGEPELIGGPSGASVWYSWTPPLTGEATISACCSAADRGLGIYTGDSLSTLQLLFGAGGAGEASFIAHAGTTYRIAIYGLLDGSSEPAMGSFNLYASVHGPVPAPPSESKNAPSPPPVDTTPPNTTISKRVLKRRPPIFVFHFHSTEPDSTFRCKLDRHPFADCPSSKRFGHLKPGRHVLEVAAVDAAGNKDPTPAVAHFKVLRKRSYSRTHKRHHQRGAG